MSLWTSLEPASATVDPGRSTTVRLRLRNTGDVVDEYRFEPVGDVAPWTTVEPPTLRLYPGTTGTVELTFAPPRSPDATAGPNPYAVRITPTEHPEATVVPEGNLTITPFTEVRAELVPPTVKGRFRGRPKLAVDNLGNTKLTASVTGSDNGDQLSYAIHPSNIQIEPGRAAFVKTTLSPRQIIWFGSKEQRPYTLSVHRSGAAPHPVAGTYVQRGVLPRWLATFLGTATALAIAFVAFWFTHAPQVQSQTKQKIEEAASTTIAPPSPSPDPSPSGQSNGQSNGQSGTQENGGQAATGGGSGSSTKKTTERPQYRHVLLRNGTTDKCAYGPGNVDDDVAQFTCNGSSTSNQLWDFDVLNHKGPNGAALFQIRNVQDAYCIDPPDVGAEPAGTNLDEYSCAAERTRGNQLWYLEKRPNGLWWIRNYTSNGLCLDVADGASDGSDMPNNKQLTLFTCSDTDDQGWKIQQT